MKILSTIVAALLLANLNSCTNKDEKFLVIQSKINDYLNCIECNNGELKEVLNYGNESVPYFEEIILKGPAPLKLQIYKKSIINDYNLILNHQKSFKKDSVTLTLSQYLTYKLKSYIYINKEKSIYALKKINNPESKLFLSETLIKAKKEKWNDQLIKLLESK